MTVLAAESPHQVMNEWTHDPREILDTYAAAIRANMLTYSIWEGNYAMVVAQQHQQIFAAAKWTRENVREYIFETARVQRKDWRTVGKSAVAPRKNEDRVHHALRTPDDLCRAAAGPPAVSASSCAVVRKEIAAGTGNDLSSGLDPGSSFDVKRDYGYARMTAWRRHDTQSPRPPCRPEGEPLRTRPALAHSTDGIGPLDNARSAPSVFRFPRRS